MDVAQVVLLAKQEIMKVFGDEQIRNLGLEEVEFEETGPESGIWKVTIGFSRPWDRELPPDIGGVGLPTAFALGRSGPLSRSYKVVRIAEPQGRVLSIKDRRSEK